MGQFAMHELGIMQSALAAVLDQARTHQAARVNRIVLRIGRLAGVDPEALAFAFDVVAKDTLASGATLEIDAVPGRARCAHCSEVFQVDAGWIFACPRCSRLSGDLTQGRELELSRIEMT